MTDAPSSTPFQVQIPTRYAVIINPRSGNGRAWRQWTALEPQVAETLGEYTVFPTKHRGHATQLTRQALREGYDRIISAGGDGTHKEVVNGFFDGRAAINPDASMAILPVGTACDLRRTLCVPKGRGAVPYLASTKVTTVDLGRLHATADGAGEEETHFITAVHIGIGGVVGEHTNRRTKVLGGFWSFLLGVITAALEYSPKKMHVEIDGNSLDDTFLEVIVANGFYDGGGMHVAPHGALNSGLFEVYTVANLGKLDILLNIVRMYRGTHDQHPDVRYYQARRVAVTSEERVVVSPDGELAGVLPATMEIVPQALRVVTGPKPRVLMVRANDDLLEVAAGTDSDGA